MLPRFLFVLWLPLVLMACLAFSSEEADAEEALASWYGPGFSGLPTASGVPYDPFGFTAAHKTMPLGTELLVSYGGSAVEVTVNDRGPYVGERELDLSQGAAEALGLTEAGVDYVEYASTNQYAAASQAVPTDAYAGGDQYSTTTPEAYASVSTTQYSSGTETILGDDQYASSEQYVEAEVPAEPATTTATPAATTSAAVGGSSSAVLVVRPGETLSAIAAEMGVSVEQLAALNAISDPDYIYAGQVLYY
ncbi:LysM peptidoglycan-binding domain-containing protein [Rubrobacter marinus]|uniref:LysM peptidoglycan-binding domain-containing protein n=1 Tax=Rubrobacter marinus TaxID=2653852 RepID=A0A6G8PXW1_9ACTN|nr:RlpA-like double-psi beta-barrel domain-containing protein [Rubrobacter marinus]QIN79008.1 LysM peptidoglycan-binding domain-containing protein [Rubrobacter marinus]